MYRIFSLNPKIERFHGGYWGIIQGHKYKNFSNYEWHYSEWSVKIKKISSTFLSLRASIQTVRSKEPNELHVPLSILAQVCFSRSNGQ